MNLAALILLLVFLFQQNRVLAKKSSERPLNVPYWQEIDDWSSCSTSCGDGIQEKLFECFKRTFYLVENIPLEKCSNIEKPKPIFKNCNFGNCNQDYVWKITETGRCSHSCGNSGVQMNEIECFVKSFGNKYSATDPEKCVESSKPKSLKSCNRFNCPANFQVHKWGNCIKPNDDCSPGKQSRNLTCLSLLGTGKVLNLPKVACYQRGLIPPASWRQCFDHVDEEKCSRDKNEIEPIITESKRVLVQMRRVTKLNLQVGHISYIIPGTKVIVTCPVKNFLPMNLIWVHKNSEYSFKVKLKERIKVSNKGKLIIKLFLNQDQGEWTCKAGNVAASVIMKLKSPSDGFKDWTIRTTLWNKEMPNEDANMDMMKHDVVRWVTGTWSRCSISCGGYGIQSRFVRCEKLENRYYYIWNEKECIKGFVKKPRSSRKCSQQYPCPKWVLMNSDPKVCTGNCKGLGKGSIIGDLKCIFQNKTTDYEKCDQTKKPFLECENPKCIVKWKISSWTKCSRSCGGQGIQARYLMCVWSNNNYLAGNLCYKAGIPVPRVIKTCKTPKCNLECVDLFKNCKKKLHYCQIEMYHYQCCKTCRGYFKSQKKILMKKKY